MNASEKHLEMIQAVISRLAGNSYAYKGWAITVTAGLVAFLGENSPEFVITALYPVGAFWVLDAHSLALERAYRKLYDAARAEDAEFSMSIKEYRRPIFDQLEAMTSATILLLYGSMLAFILLVSRVVR